MPNRPGRDSDGTAGRMIDAMGPPARLPMNYRTPQCTRTGQYIAVWTKPSVCGYQGSGRPALRLRSHSAAKKTGRPKPPRWDDRAGEGLEFQANRDLHLARTVGKVGVGARHRAKAAGGGSRTGLWNVGQGRAFVRPRS